MFVVFIHSRVMGAGKGDLDQFPVADGGGKIVHPVIVVPVTPAERKGKGDVVIMMPTAIVGFLVRQRAVGINLLDKPVLFFLVLTEQVGIAVATFK